MKPSPVEPNSTSSIVGIVLSNRKGPVWSARWFALGVGVAVHAGVGLASAMLPPPAPAVVARQPVRISVAREVQLPPPPEAPVEAPPEAPVEEAEARPSREAPAEPTEAPAEAAPAAPAMAADVVQAAAPASSAAELLDFSVVTGASEIYAGGVTASTGTSTRAVHSDNVDARRGVPGGTGTGAPARRSLARPVGQPTRAWNCRWPSAADGLDVEFQYVMVRVTVEADGQITDVTVLEDPGYGFNAEALRCASRNRLPPALDDEGNPTRKTSHRIRMRIER